MIKDGAERQGAIFLGRSTEPEYLELKFANRHGLVTGATGTGKTVTLQVLAEGLSDAGVPVFAADIKGDLSGVAAAGTPSDNLRNRAQETGLTEWSNRACPAVFWDLLGEMGHPVRATVQDMGPLLLSRLLELNETQEGVLNIIFRVAADEKLPLLDLKDLRAMANDVGQRGKSLMTKYGTVAAVSVGTIQRRLLVLEEQGADKFFGEPALDMPSPQSMATRKPSCLPLSLASLPARSMHSTCAHRRPLGTLKNSRSLVGFPQNLQILLGASLSFIAASCLERPWLVSTPLFRPRAAPLQRRQPAFTGIRQKSVSVRSRSR
jgi:hypothetical protein